MEVLIVDDNETNRKVIAIMAKRAGAKVETVTNGQEALEYLENHSPDLIFMDLSMPVMDGFEATRRIREIHSATTLPIYAVSANVTDAFQDQCQADGFNSFIPKPIDRNRISDAVKEIGNDDPST